MKLLVKWFYDMLNNRFLKELQKGLPKPLYFIWSKEDIFLHEALSDVVGAVLSSQQRDFNYDVFHPSSNAQEILDAALTLPFMAQRRLVVLKDFHQFSAPALDLLNRYFAIPCDSTCMLILSQKEPPKKMQINWDVFPLNIKESDVPLWLKQRADRKGINMSESTVEYIIEAVGPDVGLLNMELDKLALSGHQTIHEEDVMRSVGIMREYIPFNLVDALITGEKNRAFRILRTLLEGKSIDTPASVLGALNWQYRQFYDLWQNKGRRPLKMRESTFRILKKYLPGVTQKTFGRIFHLLHRADSELKTFTRPDVVLETLLIKLLQAGAKN